MNEFAMWSIAIAGGVFGLVLLVLVTLAVLRARHE